MAGSIQQASGGRGKNSANKGKKGKKYCGFLKYAHVNQGGFQQQANYKFDNAASTPSDE